MRGVSSRSLFLGVLVLGCAAALGAPPIGVFHYQGVLTDTDGNPVTGTRDVTFWLYEQAENGSSLWKETHRAVTVDAGHFSVDLGSLISFGSGIDFSGDLYLQIAVEGEVLDPRVKLRPVPKALHAVRAGTVDAVEGVPVGADTPSTGRFTTLATTGNVTLGNSSGDSVVVNGALKIASGTPGDGKVLVSDGAGNASWQELSTPGLPSRVLQVGEGAQYATIQDALIAITDNDADHPYVIKLAPGTYSGPVVLKSHVSLIGSGQSNTTIRLPAGSEAMSVLRADYASGAEGGYNTVRDLSLVHESGASMFTDGVFLEYASNVSLVNVTVDVYGSHTYAYGIRVWNADLTVDNVSVRVRAASKAYGVYLYHGEMVGDRVDVVVEAPDATRAKRDVEENRGLSVDFSSLWLRNSSVEVSGATTNLGMHYYRGESGGEYEVMVHATRLSVPDGHAWRQTQLGAGTLHSCAFNSLLEGLVEATTGDFQLFGCTDGEGNTLRTGNVPAPGTPQQDDNFTNVLTVGSGGEYATIDDALAAITDNGANRPYVIKLAPGTYEGPVVLKSYVSLVGSGRENTTIRLAAGRTVTSVVRAADGSVLRELSIDHENSAGDLARGIWIHSEKGVILDRVGIHVGNGTGAALGIHAVDSELGLSDVEVRVEGAVTGEGVSIDESEMVADRLDIVMSEPQQTRGSRELVYNIGLLTQYSDCLLANSSISVSGGNTELGVFCRYATSSTGSRVTLHDTRIAVPGGAAWRQTDYTLGTIMSSLFHCVLEGQIQVTRGSFELFGCTDGEGNTLRTGNVPSPGTPQKEDNLIDVLTVGSGGEYATITDALDAITDNDEDHRYIVKVGPGTYDEKVVMKPYVDLVGVGVRATKIQRVASDNNDSTLVLASNSTVSGVAVSHAWGEFLGDAVIAEGTTDCRIENADIAASGDYSGIAIGVKDGSLVCVDVNVQGPAGRVAAAVFVGSSSVDTPSYLLVDGCVLSGSRSLDVNTAYPCEVIMQDSTCTAVVTNFVGLMTVRDCKLKSGIFNYDDGHIVMTGCDVESVGLWTGGGAGDESVTEFRNGSISGSVASANSTRILVSFSKVDSSTSFSSSPDAVTKLFHCHDEDLNEVASPAR